MILSSQHLELKMSYNLSILRHRGHNSCKEEVGEAEEGNINWLNHDTMRPSLSELEIIWSTACSLPVFAPCCFIATISLVCNFCTTALTSLPDQLIVELLPTVHLDGIGIIWILQQSCGLIHVAEHHNASSLTGLLGYVSLGGLFSTSHTINHSVNHTINTKHNFILSLCLIVLREPCRWQDIADKSRLLGSLDFITATKVQV